MSPSFQRGFLVISIDRRKPEKGLRAIQKWITLNPEVQSPNSDRDYLVTCMQAILPIWQKRLGATFSNILPRDFNPVKSNPVLHLRWCCSVSKWFCFDKKVARALKLELIRKLFGKWEVVEPFYRLPFFFSANSSPPQAGLEHGQLQDFFGRNFQISNYRCFGVCSTKGINLKKTDICQGPSCAIGHSYHFKSIITDKTEWKVFHSMTYQVSSLLGCEPPPCLNFHHKPDLSGPVSILAITDNARRIFGKIVQGVLLLWIQHAAHYIQFPE